MLNPLDLSFDAENKTGELAPGSLSAIDCGGSAEGHRMAGQRIGYVRVSTVEQNADRQLDGLKLDRIFTDRASGRDAEGLQLQNHELRP